MLELRRRHGSSAGGGQPSRLPAGYKEVEWITMPKGGYISSGVNAKGTLRVYTKFAIRELEVAWIFGSRKGEYDSNFGVLNHTSNNFIRPAYGNDYINISNSNIKDTNIHVIDMAYGSCKLDGVTLHNFGQKEFEGIDMLIGAFRNNNVIDATAAHDFYEFTIWENSVEIRNFVPCINPSGEAGMYDLVGKQFYGNAGTGEFITGAVVGKPTLPKEYQEVEYLESTGTQYIDTKYNPFSKYDTVSIHVKHKANRDAYWLLGAVNTKDYMDDIGLASNAQRMYGYASFNILDNSKINEIVLTRNDVTINGQKYNLEYQGNQVYEKRDLYLFKANGSTVPASGLMYYCKIVTESVTYELIPCRRISDNEKGMYDIVNDVFYTNAGTGEFLVGADVHYNIPPEYQQVEWLESTGTQYIEPS